MLIPLADPKPKWRGFVEDYSTIKIESATLSTESRLFFGIINLFLEKYNFISENFIRNVNFRNCDIANSMVENQQLCKVEENFRRHGASIY